MTPNPSAEKARPAANFAGPDGSLRPSFNQSQAKTGESRITNIGPAACSQLEGNSKPKTELRVRDLAKRLRLEPACSNAIQKSDEKTKSIPMTISRLISSLV